MTPRADLIRPGTGWAPGPPALAAVAVMAALFLVLFMDRTTNSYDEGLILVGATRVMAGAVPHRDFYANYGPGQFYTLAALFRTFGTSVLVERAWDTACRTLCVVMVAVIAGGMAPRAHALAAAVVTLIWLPALGAYGYPLFPALGLALASLACLLPALNGGGRGAVIGAGLCAGLAALFRYDVGTAAFGVEGALLAIGSWFGGTARVGVVLRRLGWFVAGFAIVVVPVAVLGALAGVFPDLVFDVVTFPAAAYARTRGLPFPGLDTLREEPGEAAVYLPLLAAAAAMTVLFPLMRRAFRGDRGSRALGWSIAALLAVMLVYYLKGLVRVSVIHMAMSLVACFALTAAVAQRFPGRGPVGRIAIAVLLLAGGVLTLHRLLVDEETGRENFDWAMLGSCRVPPGLERLACFDAPLGTDEAARLVQERTAPEDPVYVGLDRTDRFIQNDVLLYFVMNRPPATKWYHFDPGLQTSARIQAEMVGELQRTRPKMVVLHAHAAKPVEPNESAVSSGVTLLDDYIRATYRAVATFGPDTVLEAAP